MSNTDIHEELLQEVLEDRAAWVTIGTYGPRMVDWWKDGHFIRYPSRNEFRVNYASNFEAATEECDIFDQLNPYILNGRFSLEGAGIKMSVEEFGDVRLGAVENLAKLALQQSMQ